MVSENRNHDDINEWCQECQPADERNNKTRSDSDKGQEPAVLGIGSSTH
jgi:hypothetical protein